MSMELADSRYVVTDLAGLELAVLLGMTTFVLVNLGTTLVAVLDCMVWRPLLLPVAGFCAKGTFFAPPFDSEGPLFTPPTITDPPPTNSVLPPPPALFPTSLNALAIWLLGEGVCLGVRPGVRTGSWGACWEGCFEVSGLSLGKAMWV